MVEKRRAETSNGAWLPTFCHRTTACLIAEKNCKRNLTEAKILQIELKIDIKKLSGERGKKSSAGQSLVQKFVYI